MKFPASKLQTNSIFIIMAIYQSWTSDLYNQKKVITEAKPMVTVNLVTVHLNLWSVSFEPLSPQPEVD